jgi:hypothetical protein
MGLLVYMICPDARSLSLKYDVPFYMVRSLTVTILFNSAFLASLEAKVFPAHYI